MFGSLRTINADHRSDRIKLDHPESSNDPGQHGKSGLAQPLPFHRFFIEQALECHLRKLGTVICCLEVCSIDGLAEEWCLGMMLTEWYYSKGPRLF